MSKNENGNIPKDWNYLPLSKLTHQIRNGYVGTATDEYRDSLDEDAIPYVVGSCVREDKFDLNNLRYVSRKFHDKNEKSQLSAGDILTVQSGHLGVTAVVDDILSGANCHAVIISTPVLEKVNPYFVSYFFNSPTGRKRLSEIFVGSSVPHINTKDLKAFMLPVPPLPEQRRIASILSQWDDSLSILSRLIDAKRQQKRGLAEQLLTGKRRLPGFEEEWEESTMGTVFSRVRRKNTEGNDHALTISGVHGLIDQREFFNKRVAAKDLSGYYLLRRGEFAYNKSYSTGYDYGAIKRLNRYEAGVVSTLYICFALQREDAVSDFYEHFFEANLLNEGLAGIAQEGARNHGLLNVSVVDFFELPVPFPPPAEQQAIATVLSTMDSEIASLEALKAKVAEQKCGLMDALLTGRVRVNVEDAS